MVMTITPMVHGGRRGRWLVSVVSHVAGGALGGALVLSVVALAAALVGPSESVRVGIALCVLGVALLFDLRIIRARVPSPTRQVPRRWREEFGLHTTAFLYGLGLGMGVTTRVYFAITYAIFIAAALLLPFALAAAVGAAFGLARSASVWVTRSARSHEVLEEIVDRRESRREAARWLNVGAVAAATALLLASNL